MKTTREKLYFGYIGASALLAILTVILSVFLRVELHLFLVTPTYLYNQLLLTGIALGEWWQIAVSGVLLLGQIGGVILRWKGYTKWSNALIFPALWVHTISQMCMVLIYLKAGELSAGVLLHPYFPAFVLNLALLILYRPVVRQD